MPALKLSPARRAELRAQAHALKPVVLIGADGLTDAVLAEIGVHLEAHGLIKVRVFGDERDERVALYEQICDTLNAAPIQHIGKLLVIWRPKEADRVSTVKIATTTKSAKAAGTRRIASAPSAREAAANGQGTKRPRGGAPRLVKVVKQVENPTRKPKPTTVLVRGNERVTAGGTIKRAKKRQTSAKRQHQAAK